MTTNSTSRFHPPYSPFPDNSLEEKNQTDKYINILKAFVQVPLVERI